MLYKIFSGFSRTTGVFFSGLFVLSLVTGCSDFTDIEPKGKNLLNDVDDIELLFNKNMNLYDNDMRNLGGGGINATSNVPSALSQPNKGRSAYLYSFADSPDDISRFEMLTTSDGWYTDLYSYVGKVVTPVLQQVATATGSEAQRNALKAEALTMRAYCHYLLLQKYAKAYDPATAATDPAIAYVKEDASFSASQPKLTVAEVYNLCLQDVNDAIALNALPERQPNVYRINKPAMYAVKALICLGMDDYATAEQAASDALALNSSLYDYYANQQTQYSYGNVPFTYSVPNDQENPENYFSIPETVYDLWVQPDVAAQFEPGYATFALFPTMKKVYKDAGAVIPSYAYYENYDVELGLDGWEAGEDFDHYVNASGLSTPMMLLVMAECELRKGSVDKAMGYLDQLRASRLDPAAYQPLRGTVTTKTEAIKAFKRDYLAENIWTQWNFIAQKRWNTDADWQETLTRTIGGQTYTLSPSSDLWVFPFPSNVREINPNMTSNKNH